MADRVSLFISPGNELCLEFGCSDAEARTRLDKLNVKRDDITQDHENALTIACVCIAQERGTARDIPCHLASLADEWWFSSHDEPDLQFARRLVVFAAASGHCEALLKCSSWPADQLPCVVKTYPFAYVYLARLESIRPRIASVARQNAMLAENVPELQLDPCQFYWESYALDPQDDDIVAAGMLSTNLSGIRADLVSRDTALHAGLQKFRTMLKDHVRAENFVRRSREINNDDCALVFLKSFLFGLSDQHCISDLIDTKRSSWSSFNITHFIRERFEGWRYAGILRHATFPFAFTLLLDLIRCNSDEACEIAGLVALLYFKNHRKDDLTADPSDVVTLAEAAYRKNGVFATAALHLAKDELPIQARINLACESESCREIVARTRNGDERTWFDKLCKGLAGHDLEEICVGTAARYPIVFIRDFTNIEVLSEWFPGIGHRIAAIGFCGHHCALERPAGRRSSALHTYVSAYYIAKEKFEQTVHVHRDASVYADHHAVCFDGVLTGLASIYSSPFIDIFIAMRQNNWCHGAWNATGQCSCVKPHPTASDDPLDKLLSVTRAERAACAMLCMLDSGWHPAIAELIVRHLARPRHFGDETPSRALFHDSDIGKAFHVPEDNPRPQKRSRVEELD